MVKNITGYYVVFTGKPDVRRASIRLNLQSGLVAMNEWNRGGKVWIKGNGYQNWEIASFEKIVSSQLDVQRALRDGEKVVDEDELKQLISGINTQPAIPPGIPKTLLS